MEEVVFGLKCDFAARYIVVKVLEGRERQVRFYEIREAPGTFELTKHAFDDLDELLASFPERHRSSFEAFKALSSPSADGAE